MTEDDKHKLFDNLVKTILFPRSVGNLLEKHLKKNPASTETVAKPAPTGDSYTAEIDEFHTEVPPLTVTAQTREELERKIEEAGLKTRTMTIIKHSHEE